MVLLQDFVIGMAFLAICYLFCKNSSKILPGRKRWLKVIKIVAVVSFVINVVIFFWQLAINTSDWDLCTTWFYVLMQSAQSFAVLISLVSGLYIRKSLLEMQPNSSAEYKFFVENQTRALRQI
jgi:amino acid transporter